MPTPYDVKCDECGDDLEITSRKMDSDGDVTCRVRPCSQCLDYAATTAIEQNEAEGK